MKPTIPALLLCLLAHSAFARPPAAEASKTPKTPQRISTKECRTRILRADILFRSYLYFCPKNDVLQLSGSLKRLNNAYQRQGYLLLSCPSNNDSDINKAIDSIPNLRQAEDFTARNPVAAISTDAETAAIVAAHIVPFCTANRTAFQQLVEHHNSQ